MKDDALKKTFCHCALFDDMVLANPVRHGVAFNMILNCIKKIILYINHTVKVIITFKNAVFPKRSASF